jgi:hypothetical protein
MHDMNDMNDLHDMPDTTDMTTGFGRVGSDGAPFRDLLFSTSTEVLDRRCVVTDATSGPAPALDPRGRPAVRSMLVAGFFKLLSLLRPPAMHE